MFDIDIGRKNKKHFVYNVYTYVFWRGLWTMLQEAMRKKYSSVKQESNFVVLKGAQIINVAQNTMFFVII